MLAIAHIDQAIIPAPAIRMNDTAAIDVASHNGLQRALACIGDDLRVDTWPLRLKIPNTTVLLPAPRPRLPLTRRGPKYASSTSTVPRQGAVCSQTRAIRCRIA
jgi:hypothetical protein